MARPDLCVLLRETQFSQPSRAPGFERYHDPLGRLRRGNDGVYVIGPHVRGMKRLIVMVANLVYDHRNTVARRLRQRDGWMNEPHASGLPPARTRIE